MEYHKIFEELKNRVTNGCDKLTQVIYKYYKEEEDRCRKKQFSMLFENFKNIQVICNDIDIKAFTQAGATLRTTIEQFAILKVIIPNKKVLDDFIKLEDLKYQKNIGNKESEKELRSLHSNYKTKHKVDINFNDFCDYGWMEVLDKTSSLKSVLDEAQFSELIEWRNRSNNFIHSNFTFLTLEDKRLDMEVNKLIYLVGVIYEHMIFLLNDLTHMNFYIDGLDYSSQHNYSLYLAEEYLARENQLIKK